VPKAIAVPPSKVDGLRGSAGARRRRGRTGERGTGSSARSSRCDDQTMPESPIDILLRWEQHGAVWRARSVTETTAVVDLCTCTGEPVDQLRSSDPAVLRYLADRPRSDED
jgi:hypothetical protein